MTTKNIVIVLCILFTISHVFANPLASNNHHVIKNSYYPILSQSPTTNSPDTSIEDPSNAAASTTIQNIDELCEFKCYDNVIEAQALFADHVNLMKKEKSLIRRKSKLSLSDGPDIVRPKSKPTQQPNQQRRTLGSLTSANSDNNYTSYSTTPNSASRSPTIRNRSLTSYDNEQIVVSRLRVARSTNRIDDHEPLRQLRLKLEKKFNETCKSLWAVQSCLGDISKPCIGNLHYHSYDVIANQWFEKLNCPPSRNPNFIPFKVLTRSVPRDDDIEKIPIARPVSSKEATRDKLMKMGVVLSPTLNSQPAPARFASLPVHSLDPHRTMNKNQYAKNQNLLIAQAILIGCILTLMMSLIILTAFYFKRPPKI